MPKKQKKFSNQVHVKEDPLEETDVTDEPEAGKKYNKRSIQSNWGKYEIEIPDGTTEEEESAESANDFNSLAKNVNASSHTFRFKSEQNWEKEIAEKKPFQLNLNLQALSAGLACIPFYDRIGLDKREFSERDLKKCDDFAEKSSKKFENSKNDYFKPDVDLEALSRYYESVVKKNKDESELKRKARFSTGNRHQASQDHGILKPECKKEIKLGSTDDDKIDELNLSANNNNDLGDISEQLTNIDIDDIEINKMISDEVPDVINIGQPKSGNEDENLEDWLDSVLDS